MRLPIEPYLGVGPIRLGMSRAQVRTVVPSPSYEFKKFPESPSPLDVYDEVGLHIHYTAADVCEAVEMFAPASPTLSGRTLVGEDFEKVVSWLREKDPALEIDRAGLKSRALGIALYAPAGPDEPHVPVEAVMVFRRNYYEDDEAARRGQ
jgi:hypothetical protein